MPIATDTLHLSDLAPRTIQSEIRAMSVACDAIGGVNLAQGVCDTEPPPIVLESAQRAIRDGQNIYTRLDGIPRLRRAIAAQLAHTHGIQVDPDREMLITSGATGAFQAAAAAILNPSDEVLLFEPFYGYHAGMLRSLRAVPVPVAMSVPSLEASESEWTLDLAAVRAAITPRTRAMMINTPSNPAGKVFTLAELEGLAAIAEAHDLFLFTDEIYEHFIYPTEAGEARKHLSPASLPNLRARTILMSGFSKTFSVTGWRVGYLVADARWLPSIGYFHDMAYVCAPAPLQHGVADGVEQLPPSFYTALSADHLAKRTLLVDALRAAGLTPHVPDGAYYILASTGALEGANAAEKSRDLLRRTGVAAVAGSAFFRPGSAWPASICSASASPRKTPTFWTPAHASAHSHHPAEISVESTLAPPRRRTDSMASAMASIVALKDTHQTLKSRMEKTVDDFRANLLSARTGRASVHMLDQVKVDYYGTDTPVSQVAQITTPEAQLILVQPWEISLVPAIEKAIRTSNQGFNPMHDGRIIRVPIPPMNEERRKEAVKNLATVLEGHKTSMRNIRRDGNESIKKAAKDKLISADDEKRAAEEVQQLTDAEIKRLDELFRSKEKELMTV